MSSRALVWQQKLAMPIGPTIVRARARGREATRMGALVSLPQDKYAAADQLNSEIYALAAAVVTAAGGDSGLLPRSSADAIAKADVKRNPDWASHVAESNAAIKKSHLASYWYDTVSPFFSEWRGFYNDHSHSYDGFTVASTSWDTYTHWFERLNAMRASAKARGITLGPDPVTPPGDIIDQMKKAFGEAWNIVKWVLIGVALLAGVGISAFLIKELKA